MTSAEWMLFAAGAVIAMTAVALRVIFCRIARHTKNLLHLGFRDDWL